MMKKNYVGDYQPASMDYTKPRPNSFKFAILNQKVWKEDLQKVTLGPIPLRSEILMSPLDGYTLPYTLW